MLKNQNKKVSRDYTQSDQIGGTKGVIVAL